MSRKNFINKIALGISLLVAIICQSLGNLSLAGSYDPSLYLGMPTQLMIQPYVSVEVLNETSPGVYENLGPSSEPEYIDIMGYLIPISSAHNSLLLDTGANAILIVDAAAQELENTTGYQTDGTFLEIGVGGTTEYDISAPYRFSFAGSDGTPHYLTGSSGQGVRILSNPDSVLAAKIEEGGIAGIVGMPAMTGRVTTLGFSQEGSEYPATPIDEWDIWELIALLSGGTSMQTTFSNTLAAGSDNRYTVALDNRIQFSAEEGLPSDSPSGAALPEYADVPFLTAKVNKVGADDVFREIEGTFLLDTGAQFSIISRRVAYALGLDENGDGSIDDEAIGSISITGVGGVQESVPILCLDELRLPSEQGVDIIWNDPSDPSEAIGIQLLVMDLFPCADINCDGIVDEDDIAIIDDHRGLIVSPGDIPSGDINSDGVVDDLDLAIAQEQLGESDFIDGVFGIDMLTSGCNINVETYEIYGTPFFDQVHFDFRNWENGQGALVLDINSEYNTVVTPDIPGDANGDGKVDGSDATILATHWQQSTTEGASVGDFNGDGFVDGSDATILATNWQNGVTFSNAAVPEPPIWILLASLGLFGVLQWRRKKTMAKSA